MHSHDFVRGSVFLALAASAALLVGAGTAIAQLDTMDSAEGALEENVVGGDAAEGADTVETAPAEGAPATVTRGLPIPGNVTGAAKVGVGTAAESAVRGADVKAAGQKGVAAGVDAYMKSGTPPATAGEVPAGDVGAEDDAVPATE